MNILNDVLIYIDGGLFAVLVVYSIFLLSSLKDHKYFLWFFITAGIVQIVSIVTGKLNINNGFVMPIYICAQILGLGAYYFKLIRSERNEKWLKRALFGLFGLFLVELGMQLYRGHGVFDLSWFSHFVSSMIFALFSFNVMVLKSDVVKDTGNFFIHIAVFLYSSISALVFLFGNILVDIPHAAQISIWIVHASVHLIFLFLIGRGLWITTRS